jgi:hypothetical protein
MVELSGTLERHTRKRLSSKATNLLSFRCAATALRFSMSEYVEARYAKLILDEARLAEQDVASKLVKELLRDLSSLQRLNCASAQTVSSIRLLALSLDGGQSLHVREWDAANRAAEAWCQSAFK